MNLCLLDKVESESHSQSLFHIFQCLFRQEKEQGEVKWLVCHYVSLGKPGIKITFHSTRSLALEEGHGCVNCLSDVFWDSSVLY